ncbi:MAG: excinuclease ABC subunit UvrC [gamma proteobacterium symbiont of Bathyaustriella thionipta]|nr:excinuclease ABC subunit UvrC [gamma proteobacterium symbiont of Bathyaustriella thionipta]MCU7950526.1 excinuclease ABC subunit UvrC [gamma proteobacterium symbiont of Bathyaustriella thionipta]MCU7952971.1 excinuclease ABC subunit UvrC [gamma proteobacterium symbiont of Bathyaustriella thionipta]MCU7957278.1 excinuclease ABC subunit UvrC [gamma proteobacterium symbiont of Bathyaustriella thionipta]MCU7966145.1 excinuclease ABC subunit UvrC [gamma proteobacterium symbiont of Bathyaustriella
MPDKPIKATETQLLSEKTSFQNEEQSLLVQFDHDSFLKELTTKPGVYRMIDANNVVIYVGKAKNLKNRVSSYFRKSGQSPKTSVMVNQIANIEILITHTESEALLLENNLIKTLKPRYNILLRDDKSYPYIFLSEQDEFPRLAFHRGARKKKGRYFGPYPNGHSVKTSLNLLQKLFPVRQCEDSFYKNRSRACLQYQIKRCKAPCVDLVCKEEYAEDVRHTVLFLEGKSNQVIDELIVGMDQAAQQLHYEKAAVHRDQIANLRRLQEKQYVSNEKGDLDIIAIEYQQGVACIQLFFIRDGLNLGNKSFFPKNARHQSISELLSAFIAQFYISSSKTDRFIPSTILVSHPFEDRVIIETILQEQSGHKVNIKDKVRGERARWLKMAQANAQTALMSRLSNRASVIKRFEDLQEVLKMDTLPERLECFDISHSSGEATVASCVVFDQAGPLKTDYRRFNIDNITPGDDYAAMYQALTRRYRSFKNKELIKEGAKLPDLLVIDGGKGQVKQAREVMEALKINTVQIIGITKGEGRKAELDTLLLSETNEKVILPPNSKAMHLIQHIRDEAHRFAITGHKNRRAKTRKTSPLEKISGLGPKRRQLLLKQFGGLQEVTRAGVEDLAIINGISKALAQKIYDHFHS